MKNLYLILDILVIAGPLALSFDKKVAFYKKWIFACSAIICMMVIFIPIDSLFTLFGVWGFNEKYLIGNSFLSLPLEEWLFFPVTTFAVLFLYECLNTYFKKDVLQNSYKLILLIFASVGLICTCIFPLHIYTSIKMGGCSVLIFGLLFIGKPHWLSRFTFAFIVSLIPFFIMNSILTGSFIEQEIVWYNSDHILNIRIGTIPVEDIYYSMLMLLIATFFYEVFKKKSIKELLKEMFWFIGEIFTSGH